MPLATPTTLTTLCLSESHTHSFILHFLEVNLSVGCVKMDVCFQANRCAGLL